MSSLSPSVGAQRPRRHVVVGVGGGIAAYKACGLIRHFTEAGDEPGLRKRLKAPAFNVSQDLYVSRELKTGRVMAKDEDVCLHCGLCAERCPTGAWDMQKFSLALTQAGPRARATHATEAA